MNKAFDQARDLFNNLLENICYENDDPYLQQVICGIQQAVDESESIEDLVNLAEELSINIRDFEIDDETYNEAENLIYRLQEFID